MGWKNHRCVLLLILTTSILNLAPLVCVLIPMPASFLSSLIQTYSQTYTRLTREIHCYFEFHSFVLTHLVIYPKPKLFIRFLILNDNGIRNFALVLVFKNLAWMIISIIKFLFGFLTYQKKKFDGFSSCVPFFVASLGRGGWC